MTAPAWDITTGNQRGLCYHFKAIGMNFNLQISPSAGHMKLLRGPQLALGHNSHQMATLVHRKPAIAANFRLPRFVVVANLWN